MTIVQEIWVTDHGTVIRATDEGARRIIPGIAAKMEQLKCQRSIWLSTDAGVTAKHTHVPFPKHPEDWIAKEAKKRSHAEKPV